MGQNSSDRISATMNKCAGQRFLGMYVVGGNILPLGKIRALLISDKEHEKNENHGTLYFSQKLMAYCGGNFTAKATLDGTIVEIISRGKIIIDKIPAQDFSPCLPSMSTTRC